MDEPLEVNIYDNNFNHKKILKMLDQGPLPRLIRIKSTLKHSVKAISLLELLKRILDGYRTSIDLVDIYTDKVKDDRREHCHIIIEMCKP